MKYRSTSSFLFLLLISMISAGVYAQVPVKDRSDIVGSWKLEKTAPNRDGSNGNKETMTWDFRPDGTVIISGYNKYMGQDTRFEKHYEIEVDKGSIVKIKDHRGIDEYKVVEKKAGEMVLEGPFGYYFFKKK